MDIWRSLVKIRNLLTTISVLFCGLTSQSEAAEVYRLFYDNQPVANYNSIVAHLRPHDSIVFSNNQTWQLGQYLGGNQDRIFELKDSPNQTIRIASDATKHTIENYYYGMLKLKAAGVLTPAIYFSISAPHEYIIAEKLHVFFTWEKFLTLDFQSPQLKELLTEEFLNFAQSLHRFSRIGDQHNGQIGYTNKGWLWLDTNIDHLMAERAKDSTIFEAHTKSWLEWLAPQEARGLTLYDYPQIATLNSQFRKKLIAKIQQARRCSTLFER